MTPLQLIDDTVEFYAADPAARRAYVLTGDAPMCAYLTEDGRRCAVGRWLDPKVAPAPLILGVSATVGDIADVLKRDELDECLVTEAQGAPLEFWRALQRLHDNDDMWNTTGLSPLGTDYVDKLRAEYGGC